ncbi:hypothetical protein Val02_92140 [Virgisporangium aliadipatigenens]|uniref:Uncharacterized protein n=1 Tax=Virgisporangium aliadipatigenens TaxID=741659 RepID=A0A8J3YZB0_9ACTN|nr:hypothetical protein Val02_92140 [Virgisporangium aliadipatigenens]
MNAPTPPAAGLRRCGCRDRNRPANKVAELGNTPGVHICAGCALRAAHRAGILSTLADIRYAGRQLLRSWRHRGGEWR